MPISNRPVPTASPTLNTLIAELGTECQNVVALVNQLRLSHLSDRAYAEILAELLTAATYLQTHCDEEFQALIAEEMDKLPDDEEQNEQ